MPDSVPSFDDVPWRVPAPMAPLPPESPVEQLGDGIVRCEIATPYMMGATNCWLAVGESNVLCVDPGADPDTAAHCINAALSPYRRTITDIETIVVTHTHPDHCGAAAGLAEAADATVAVGGPEVDRMAGRPYPPGGVAAALLALGAPVEQAWRAACSQTMFPPVPSHRIRTLQDGTQMEAGGRRWDVHVVAGHSPGHVMLVGDGMILAGDQLLANVFPAIHLGPLGPHHRGQRERDGLAWAPSVHGLLASMERFDRGFDSAAVLPGHGSAFVGTARPVGRVRRYHRVRCELVATRLQKRGRSSAWDLALEMYAGLVSPAGIDRRFGSAVAEIAGRLEALVQDGRATFTLHGEAVVFSPT